ncbi:hypothetical protein [Trichocoleus sp. DQ-U1]|uniref:hypothetical protein n=1 Tax=Trichocoleus sp. DQ-U1 TaxID=2933926 RepID=UPI003297D4BB
MADLKHIPLAKRNLRLRKGRGLKISLDEREFCLETLYATSWDSVIHAWQICQRRDRVQPFGHKNSEAKD